MTKFTKIVNFGPHRGVKMCRSERVNQGTYQRARLVRICREGNSLEIIHTRRPVKSYKRYRVYFAGQVIAKKNNFKPRRTVIKTPDKKKMNFWFDWIYW